MKSRPALRPAILLLVWLAASLIPALCGFLFAPSSAAAQEDWEKEFQAVCGKTDDAMTLTIQELRTLVERCDDLKASIDKLEGSARKVFMKRLQMCRDLYAFTLETKEQE